MASLEEQVLKISKEIVVKFIETGRVSPNSFDEIFRAIHKTVKETAYQSNDNSTIKNESFQSS
jgi:predicted transcriptional regulator